MRLMGLIALSLVVGCTGRTEVVLGVATDLHATGQIDTVQLTALRDGVTVVQQSWMLGSAPLGLSDLPGSFGLYSPDGSGVQVVVDVQGYLSGSTTPVADRQSIFSLVPGLTLFERLTLTSVCNSVGGPTCAADETCAEGVCVPQAVDAHIFPKYTSDLPTHIQCTSNVHYIDANTGDPMPLSGAGCDPDEFCQEATCYKPVPSPGATTGTTGTGTTGSPSYTSTLAGSVSGTGVTCTASEPVFGLTSPSDGGVTFTFAPQGTSGLSCSSPTGSEMTEFAPAVQFNTVPTVGTPYSAGSASVKSGDVAIVLPNTSAYSTSGAGGSWTITFSSLTQKLTAGGEVFYLVHGTLTGKLIAGSTTQATTAPLTFNLTF